MWNKIKELITPVVSGVSKFNKAIDNFEAKVTGRPDGVDGYLDDGFNWVKEKTLKGVETVKEKTEDIKTDVKCRIAAKSIEKHLDKVEEEEKRLDELAKKLGPWLQKNGY